MKRAALFLAWTIITIVVVLGVAHLERDHGYADGLAASSTEAQTEVDYWARKSFYRGLLVSCYSIYGDQRGCEEAVTRAMIANWYDLPDPEQLRLQEWKPGNTRFVRR